MEKNILLCGVGGQGTVLASKLIASAAMGMGEVVHSAETIGMAQRGGSVTSHVRIGEKAFSPLIPGGKADVLIAFEPAEAVRNLRYLSKSATVIVNRIPVQPVTESLGESHYDGEQMVAYLQEKCARVVVVDAAGLCEQIGSAKFFNVAILGVAVGTGATGLDRDIVLREIESRVPARFADPNREAFLAGIRLAEQESKNDK